MATKPTNTLTVKPSTLSRHVLLPHRSRALLLSLLHDWETRDLAVASTDLFCLLVPYASALRIRDVSKMPLHKQLQAFRPVITYSGSWPRLAAFENHLANLPGIGAPVTFGANANADTTSCSRTLLPKNSVKLESLKLVEDSTAHLLSLEDIVPLLPHLRVLTLSGEVALGDLRMLAPLHSCLRRLAINGCSRITGSLDDVAAYSALEELSIDGANDRIVDICGTLVLNKVGSFVGSKNPRTFKVQCNGTYRQYRIDSLVSKAWVAQIIVLDLAGTSARGNINTLSSCISLKMFRAEGCMELTGDIGVLTNCKLLSRFSCRLCRHISGDINVFVETPDIQSINLTSTNCSGDISVFKHTPELENINISSTHLCSGDINVFEFTPKIENINLASTRCSGDIAVFARTKSLQQVIIHSREVTGNLNVFEQTPFIEHFNLARTECTGSFLANDLMHLTNYYDENDPLSKQVFQRDKLVKHFANVASINLSFANGLAGTFSGDMIRVLSDIRLKHGQESVRLPSCGRFALTNHLVNVADITYVDLSSIILLKGDIKIFSCAPAIKHLDLSRTQCSGDIEVFKYTPALAHVNLQGSNCSGAFTGEIISLFSDIRLKQGQETVNFKQHARRKLSRDNTNAVEITHIDLTGIKFLEGFDFLAKCKNLVVLNVNNCFELTGDIKIFENTPLLEDIVLTQTKCFGDIAVFKFTKNLKEISIDGCRRINGDIAVFKSTSSITKINIRQTKCIGDIKVFRSTPSVTNLNIRQTKCFGDVEVLGTLRDLEVVDIDNTSCTGDIRVFEYTPSVLSINLGRSRCFGDIKVFEHTTSVKEIVCDAAAYTGDIGVFVHTKELEKAIFSYGSGITGNVMVFKNTPSIKEIDICSTQCYGDIGVLEFCKSLLVLVAFECSDLHGDIKVFKSVPFIKEINVESCLQITGELKVFKEAKYLEEVVLYKCRGITGDRDGIRRALPNCQFQF